MAKKTAPLLPATEDLLHRFGERLRVARLRRRLTAKQVAERAGMAPMTLRSLEHGGSGVTMGAYLSVMQVLGVEKDLDLLGKADPLGRELQDAQLTVRTRVVAQEPAPRPAPRRSQARDRTADQARDQATKPSRPAKASGDWIQKGAFASSDALARLLDPAKKKAR